MTGPANLDWLYVLGGWLIGGSAALLLLWSLFRDRNRKLRRCPKCWYDMSGTPGMQCPECGRTAKSEQRLHRTRRRWKIAALACMLGLVGYAVGSVPRYQTGGWVALVPAEVLVLIAPAEPMTTSGGWSRATFTGFSIAPQGTLAVDTTAETLTNEVWTRLRAGRLAHWQSQLFLSRYLKTQHFDHFKLFTLPQRWAVGEPIPVALRGNIEGMELLARSLDGTWESQTARLPPATSPGNTTVVEIGLGTPATVRYRTKGSASILIQGTREDLLERINSDSANTWVKTALNPHVSMNGFEPVVVIYDRSAGAPWDSIDFGLSYTFEVTLDGTPLFRGRGLANWLEPVWKNWEEFAVPEPAREAVKSGRAIITIRGDWTEVTKQYMSWPFDKPSAACWTGDFSQTLETRWHPGINKGD